VAGRGERPGAGPLRADRGGGRGGGGAGAERAPPRGRGRPPGAPRRVAPRREAVEDQRAAPRARVGDRRPGAGRRGAWPARRAAASPCPPPRPTSFPHSPKHEGPPPPRPACPRGTRPPGGPPPPPPPPATPPGRPPAALIASTTSARPASKPSPSGTAQVPCC